MKSYTRISWPTTEPVSTTDALAFLRAASNDADLVGSLITVAREMIEDFTGRVLGPSAYLLAADSWNGEELHRHRDDRLLVGVIADLYGSDCDGLGHHHRTLVIDRSPLVSVQTVQYYAPETETLTTLDPSGYRVITATTPGCIQVLGPKPLLSHRPDAVQVAFIAGPASGQPIRPTLIHAIKLLVSHLYERREAVGVPVSELPLNLRYLLESQRIAGWSA